MKYPIICLCGSTTFKKEYEQMEKELALQGFVVITVSCYPGVDDDQRIIEKKEMLDEIHFQKIEMSDEVFIINKGGYIGNSTINEIKYAKKLGKKVRYLESNP